MPEIDHRVILGGEKSSFKVQELCLRIKREKEFKNRDRRNLKIEIGAKNTYGVFGLKNQSILNEINTIP